jgi:[ribosomal protein S5]-alanine N-acetyltransferase
MSLPYPDSLCHRCAAPPKYVRTATSVFLRCPLLPAKYPPQPVLRCALYKPPVLETQRLLLREISFDDLDFMAAMLGDPEVMRYFPAVEDREGARRSIEKIRARYAADGHSFWLAVDKSTAEPIGRIGLLKQTLDGADHAEVAYMVHAPHQRRGYAVEGAAAVRDWAFARGYDHVISLIRPENAPSEAVARKLGMQPTRHIEFSGLDHRIWRLDRQAPG